jgi:ABC-type histidine transport system ATPase subunit
MIEVRDIHKVYRAGEVETTVLRGVSLAIARGEFIALMGASGSGKTTLMNVLGCLDQPSSGEYWLDGEEVGRLSSDRRAALRCRKIGFVFQSFNLLARTSALDNVLMPVAYSRDTTPAARRQRARELLERVGLGDRWATSRPSCPAASSNALPWRARSSTRRSCCSPTSRREASTRAPAPSCWRCSASCTHAKGSRSWSSRTTTAWRGTRSVWCACATA